jgi:hypothetical protein
MAPLGRVTTHLRAILAPQRSSSWIGVVFGLWTTSIAVAQGQPRDSCEALAILSTRLSAYASRPPRVPTENRRNTSG